MSASDDGGGAISLSRSSSKQFDGLASTVRRKGRPGPAYGGGLGATSSGRVIQRGSGTSAFDSGRGSRRSKSKPKSDAV